MFIIKINSLATGNPSLLHICIIKKKLNLKLTFTGAIYIIMKITFVRKLYEMQRIKGINGLEGIKCIILQNKIYKI